MKQYVSKRIKSSVEAGYPASWTRNNFIDYLLQSDDNFIVLDKDGACKYCCLPVTTENFDLTDKMVKQFKEDGVYGDYVGGVLWGSKPYSAETLPIYGRSDRYVTKWFCEDKADAIKGSLSDRNMALLKRANAYLSSSIKSATKWSEGGGDVDRFVEWHDDTEMYMYPEVFDAVYKIFDNALGEGKSEDVREAFQRLSKEDQEKVMKLIESTGYDIKSATGWSEGSGDVSDTFLDLEDYIHELATMVVNRIAEQGYFCDYNVTGSELIFEVYLDGDGLGVFTQPIIEIGSDLSSDADLLAKDILLAVK